MADDKRFLRNLKRQIKRTGNRKLRRHLKDVAAVADEFDYGRDRSDVMNEQLPKRRERRDKSQGPAVTSHQLARRDEKHVRNQIAEQV